MKTETTPMEFTAEEVRDKFLRQVSAVTEYWAEIDGHDKKSALEGLAFSIMVILDGGTIGLPSFIVAPLPAEEDFEYHKERGENWFPQNHNSNVKCDIAGGLHELIHKYRKQ